MLATCDSALGVSVVVGDDVTGPHRISEAEGLLSQAVAGFEYRVNNGESHMARMLSIVRSSHGRVLIMQRRFDDAERMLKLALEYQDKKLGKEAQATQVTLKRLRDLYTAWNKPDLATVYDKMLVNKQ